ncbi:MAG: peptidylprolyl isomerase [Verrucomicrobiota bacterium]
MMACLVQAAGTNDLLVTARTWNIQRQELDLVMRRVGKSLLQAGRILPEEELKALERRQLDQMIFTRICLARATGADREKATNESRKFIEGLKRQQPTEEAYLRLLARGGFEPREFAEEKWNEALAAAVVDREVKDVIRIPTADARKYYDAHPEKWLEPEQVKAAHLLVASSDPRTGEPWPADELQRREERARKARDRARAGEPFGKLVQEFSDDANTRERGGVYLFARGQMEPEFEAAAFSMKPGQVSDLVRTAYGWHVIQLVERRPPQRREFAAVERQIRALLTEQELGDRITEYARTQEKDQEVKLHLASPLKGPP